MFTPLCNYYSLWEEGGGGGGGDGGGHFDPIYQSFTITLSSTWAVCVCFDWLSGGEQSSLVSRTVECGETQHKFRSFVRQQLYQYKPCNTLYSLHSTL